MVATHRASLTRRAVLHAMRQQHNLSRIVTHATRALGWRVMCAVLTLAFAAIHMRPAPTHATDAGVDGDHIFAGVSYESYGSYERCSWVRPVTIHEQGVSPAVITREWQGLTWSLYICEVDGDSNFVWLPDVSTEHIAESSRSVVRELIPMLTENFSPLPHRGVVKTPTWFWVNPLLWKPVSVTARVPTPRGILTVTTTATPETLEFSPGDGIGDTVECEGPGLPWSSFLPSFVETECQYEYPVPSSVRSDGVYRARLDVVWEITWKTNIGASGTLPDVRIGATHSLRIRELQAVVRQ
jgi:hypothetical protein